MSNQNLNSAFETIESLPPEKEAMYLKGLPRAAQYWLLYDAPTNFDSRDTYNIYRKYGRDGLYLTLVAQSIGSAMLHYPGADRETIFAMIGSSVRNLVARDELIFVYEHVRVRNAKAV